MIEAGDRLLSMVNALRARARGLFYAVMLFQQECTRCGMYDLEMIRDGQCRCRYCGEELDPTLTFQRCPECDARLILKRRHYWCSRCRQPVRSRFCFDEAVFDPAYFREMMRESRERKRAEIEKIREMLASSRSSTYYPTDPPIPDDPDGLDAELTLVLGLTVEAREAGPVQSPAFDLDLYRDHILDLVPGCVVDFDGISRLIEEPRLDRVYRFIAVIFMDHAGELCIEQDAEGRIALVGT